MKIPTSIATMLAGIALTLLSLWYGQNHGLLPVAASDDAVLIDGLFNSMMTVSFGLFLLVEGVLVVAIIKFRRPPGDETDGPPIHGNIPLEIVWTAIPAVIVLVIGVYSFDIYSQMGGFDPDAATDELMSSQTQVAMLPGEGMSAPLIEPSAKKPAHHHHMMAVGVGASPESAGKPADLTVDIMGLQYAWIFTYPETGIVSGELHVPAGKDVRLNLKAQDVLHAFWLPEFRLKQDAIPGRDAEIRFTPKRIGDYPIVCAELCGAYHGSMVTRMYVQPVEEYDAWIQQQVAMQASSNESVAAATLEQRVAALTTELSTERSDADFLTNHAGEMGVSSQALEALTQIQTHAVHDLQTAEQAAHPAISAES